MDESKKYRILTWIIAILVFCNAGLILTLWLKPACNVEHPPETPRDFVVRELHFTPVQTREYDVLVNNHQQAMRTLRREAMDYRQLLFNNLKNEPAQPDMPDSISKLIATNQQKIEMVTYQHFAQVRALCNESQKKDFDNIIGDVIRKMNGHNTRPPFPPGRRGMPPPPGDRNDNPSPSDGPQ